MQILSVLRCVNHKIVLVSKNCHMAVFLPTYSIRMNSQFCYLLIEYTRIYVVERRLLFYWWGMTEFQTNGKSMSV